MTIELWALGKENTKLLDVAIEEYIKRVNRYHAFKIVTIDNTKINKALPKETIFEREAELVQNKLQTKDLLIVLDERGQSIGSIELAEKMNATMNLSPTRIIFLIGGSYGIAPSLKASAYWVMALSKFTFPHQLVRLLFVEQLYRACSILKNEKYHHE
jgi:23S rRNA (pseudouridine1915-N3)-methyltransferase